MSQKKSDRKINLIVLHCSDSDNPKHDNIETIRQWHTERGFTGPDGIPGNEDDVGYHFFIPKNGVLTKGRDINEIGAGVKGHNAHSIHICFSGRSNSKFTSHQFSSGRQLINRLLAQHNLSWDDVKLHNQLDPHKTCPNFTFSDLTSR